MGIQVDLSAALMAGMVGSGGCVITSLSSEDLEAFGDCMGLCIRTCREIVP